MIKEENRGGKRKGSGQKLRYGEETKSVSFKCPKSKVDTLKSIVTIQLKEWEVPRTSTTKGKEKD